MDTLLSWMRRRLAEIANVADPDLDRAFVDFGLDSKQVAQLTAELEEEFQVIIDPSTAFEAESVAQFLAEVSNR